MNGDADDTLKVTTEAQLGLIGGTMGLLTGFSILSGVEIIYYILRLTSMVVFVPFSTLQDDIISSTLRLFMSLRVPRDKVLSAVNSRFGNHLMRKH